MDQLGIFSCCSTCSTRATHGVDQDRAFLLLHPKGSDPFGTRFCWALPWKDPHWGIRWIDLEGAPVSFRPIFCRKFWNRHCRRWRTFPARIPRVYFLRNFWSFLLSGFSRPWTGRLWPHFYDASYSCSWILERQNLCDPITQSWSLRP